MIRTIAMLACGLAGGLLMPSEGRAQVRDAEYRGTIVCGKLPFAQDPIRAAIEIKMKDNQGPYERPVHMPVRSKIAGKETGTAKVEGDKIALTGGWKGDKASYDATYSGTFVRRSAKVTGTQTWTHGGKTYTRTCSGAVQRPLAGFIPKQRKPAQ